MTESQEVLTLKESMSNFLPNLIMLALVVVFVMGMWRVFVKAGQPGWAVIIPIYNLYILLKIIGRPGWWLLFYLIPIVNIVVSLINAIDLAKAFGKSTVFGVFGLWLFAFVGYLILGFGSAKYIGTTNTPQSPQPPAPQPALSPAPATPVVQPPQASTT